MVTFPITLKDPKPSFQGHGIFEVEYICLRDKVSVEHQYEIIRNLSNSTNFNDLEWPLTRISRSIHFLKSNIGKTACLKDKVNIAQEETIPNMEWYYVWW